MPPAPTETLLWLVKESQNLCALREVEKVSTAMVDGLINLCRAERGYLLLAGAGAKNLLPVAARGAGGLVAPGPDRRVLRAAERALAEPKSAHVLRQHDVVQSACVVITIEQETAGVLYVDGKLDEASTESQYLMLYAQSAAIALDNARFFERASNDLLTGLPNHSLFSDALHKALRRPRGAQAHSGVLLLDLDGFKRVNRAAGTEVGDRALVDVAHTLRDSLCADGLVARYNSDCFVVLLNHDTKTRIDLRLRDVGERARAAINAKIYAGVQLSACVGAVPLCEALEGNVSQAARATLALCEDHLHMAQRRGPGSFEVFTAPTD